MQDTQSSKLEDDGDEWHCLADVQEKEKSAMSPAEQLKQDIAQSEHDPSVIRLSNAVSLQLRKTELSNRVTVGGKEALIFTHAVDSDVYYYYYLYHFTFCIRNFLENITKKWLHWQKISIILNCFICPTPTHLCDFDNSFKQIWK